MGRERAAFADHIRAFKPIPQSAVAAFDAFADAMGIGATLADRPLNTKPVAVSETPSHDTQIDHALMRIICPSVGPQWVEPIRAACRKYRIDNIRRIAAFISQLAHESSCFSRLEENLNYTTAARIRQVWPSRFPTIASAQPFVRNPQGLANHVYANRMGNGPPSSGDGWRFRGAGPIQLTGRANWTAFARAKGMSVEQALSYVRTPEGGCMAAGWFWDTNGINALADAPGVEDVTRRINGGTIGLADRTSKFNALVNEMLRRERS